MADNNDFWKEQSKRFDESADYYDQYRPGYPEELIDCILEKTQLQPGSELLEIGAGSGKATLPFVDRGFNLHCIEPGANLAAAGMEKFSPTKRVQYTLSRFEEWEAPKEKFDFAFSAQSFHWVPKPKGFELCAHTLKPGGYLGLYWNMYLTQSSPVDLEMMNFFQKNNLWVIYLQNEEEAEKGIDRNIHEIKESGYFNPPRVYRFPWSQNYTAEEYLGFIKTGNGYLSLTQEIKERVDKEILGIINQHGGKVIRPYLCVLYLAQKK